MAQPAHTGRGLNPMASVEGAAPFAPAKDETPASNLQPMAAPGEEA